MKQSKPQLGDIIQLREQFEKIKLTLFDLEKAHNQFGVEIIQFEVVKSALILSIQFSLMGECTESITQAWSKYYDMIAKEMIKGLYGLVL